MAQEIRDFKAHPNLLWDVITRQAGTLGKAMLEGVCNSCDAGATRIDVSLGADSFSIVDNGRGFRDKAEITQVFEIFGQPHAEGDALYGWFRMGRGQIMAFAKTVWRSNGSVMRVDIKKDGLRYEYAELSPPEPGCRIDGMLYEPLSLGQVRMVADEVVRDCRYIAAQLFINGAQVNDDPAKKKWPLEGPDFWGRVSPGGGRITFFVNSLSYGMKLVSGNIDISVPDGVSGGWRVETFTVSQQESDFTRLRAVCGHPAEFVSPGSYKRLMHGGTVVMSNTPHEILTHRPVIRMARGRVLLNGLGLGVCLKVILADAEVEHVTVVEKEADVLRLVGPTYECPRLTLIHGDAYTRELRRGERYDVAWHDIWNEICSDNADDMRRLMRKYARRAAWQGCWCYYETLRDR
jgi:hypothetical protein